MQTLNIGGEEVSYRVKQGKSGKHATIRFLSINEIEVVLPKDVHISAEELLKKKSSLIEKRRRELLSRQMIQDKDTILYKGRKLRIEVIRKEQTPRNRITVEADKIQVSVIGNEDPEALLRIWLTRKTQQLVDRIVQRYSTKFQVQPLNIAVKQTRRWGYCTNIGRLVFNWQLATLPLEIAEYVVIHEYSHLSEFNHQKEFHKILASIVPDYRKREKELKRYIPIEDATRGLGLSR